MPVIRTENPAAFRAEIGSMLDRINDLEVSLQAIHQHENMVVCSVCGEKAPQDDARLRFDGAVICQSCLPAYKYCQGHKRYFIESEVFTFFDGNSTNEKYNSKQFHTGWTSNFTCDECGGLFYGGPIRIQGNSKRVCRCCANKVAFKCPNCSQYHATEGLVDDCCGDRLHYESKNPDMTVQVGTSFARFSARPVGLEIETGQGGRKTKVLRWIKNNLPTWGMTSDGSLVDSGYEYISGPMSGDIIEGSYKAFASAMIEKEIAVEQAKAGYHVHVNAKDIFKLIKDLQDAGKNAEADVCEDLMQAWGDAMVSFSRTLVAPWRRQSYFCIGNFGYRSSKGSFPRYLKKAKGSSYPPVAIREQTLEFRIFPSTANIEWHLARIEYSQKSVDLLFAAMVDSAKADSLGRLILALGGLTGQAKIDFLCAELGISTEGTKALQKMHKTWTPDEYLDGKAVTSSYKREPKARKPRTRRPIAA